jgi:hypothetical protein
MRKIAVFIGCLLLFSCGNSETVEVSKADYVKLRNQQIFVVDIGSVTNAEFKVVVIDSCEYLYAWERSSSTIFTHKGNCKFCAKKR